MEMEPILSMVPTPTPMITLVNTSSCGAAPEPRGNFKITLANLTFKAQPKTAPTQAWPVGVLLRSYN